MAANTGEDNRTQPTGSQPVPGSGGSGADQPPMEEYPDGVPDFRDPAQNPNENYYAPNEDVDQYGYQVGIDGEKNYDINVGMTGGLMDTVNAIESSPYANKGYGVREGSATNRGVGQEELSQYQLQQMLASNSPLMKQAAAQGLARGGSRGLMNSSLSTGAAQGAMIAGAQPFALQDANTYGKTASENMSATNSMAEKNLDMRGRSMEAGAMRDREILKEQLSGYGDIRKAMINIETREDDQAWRDAESAAGRSWQSGERLGSERFNADQAERNRVWTTNENIASNTLAWATTRAQLASDAKLSRGEAYAKMVSDIVNNDNKKFSVTERNVALGKVSGILDDAYPNERPDDYESSYDPSREGSGHDESLNPGVPEMGTDSDGNMAAVRSSAPYSQAANAPISSVASPSVAETDAVLAEF